MLCTEDTSSVMTPRECSDAFADKQNRIRLFCYMICLLGSFSNKEEIGHGYGVDA